MALTVHAQLDHHVTAQDALMRSASSWRIDAGLSCQRPVQGVDTTVAAAPEYGPVVLIDTAGCDMEEAGQEGGDSRLNEGEAEAALAHAARLVSLGVAPADIGVITPYSAQVRMQPFIRFWCTMHKWIIARLCECRLVNQVRSEGAKATEAAVDCRESTWGGARCLLAAGCVSNAC